MCHVCVCVFQTDIKCELVCVRLLSRQSRSCFLGEEVLKQDYIQDHRELVTIIPPLYELFIKYSFLYFTHRYGSVYALAEQSENEK